MGFWMRKWQKGLKKGVSSPILILFQGWKEKNYILGAEKVFFNKILYSCRNVCSVVPSW
jgi:hypothetical protein